MELSYAMSYCQGDLCSLKCSGSECMDIRNKEKCLAVDVVSNSDIEKYNPDGKPDCKWHSTPPYCRPNK